MPNNLDLNLISLVRLDGQKVTEPPGLHLAAAPRRPTRHRAGDGLILYLTMVGNSPLPGEIQEQLLERLAKTYYETPGSVTAALRTVAEELNQFLWERNVKNTNTGRQGLGIFTQVVLRGQSVFVAHSGPAEAFVIAAGGARPLADPYTTGRGLGLGRTTPIRYFQAELQDGDALLLVPQPVPAWGAGTLAGLHGQPPEAIQRMLLSRTSADSLAVLIQARPGKGALALVKTSPAGPEAQHPGAPAALQPERGAARPPAVEPEGGSGYRTLNAAPSAAAPAPAPASGGVTAPPPASHPVTPSHEPRASISTANAPVNPPASAPAGAGAPAQRQTGATAAPGGAPVQPATPSGQAASGGAPVQPATPTGQGASGGAPVQPATPTGQGASGGAPVQPATPTGQGASGGAPVQPATPYGAAPAQAAVFSTPEAPPAPAPLDPPAVAAPSLPRQRRPSRLGQALSGFGQGLLRLITRLLPDETTAPANVMAFIAVAVPVVIVAVASVAYVRLGRDVQYETLFAQAGQLAAQAAAQTDLQAQRSAWQDTLTVIDQAEAYRATSESQALRQQAQIALDDLELVRRIDFQPAIIGGLAMSVDVVRLAPVDRDLYMLDRTSGGVLRALSTTRGYELDRTFQCGPDPSSSSDAGPLVDLAAWPLGSDTQAAVVGLEAGGRVVYCDPGQAPEIEALAPPVDLSLGNLSVMTLYLSDFYLLDRENNTVWVYWGSDFEIPPENFFNTTAPDLSDVVDLAVNGLELYLLHADGHLTLCSYSQFSDSPTRCSEPAPYLDFRPGRENMSYLPDTPFSQVAFNPPPDPSLFFLEPGKRALYHFSLRNLAMQRQYQPLNDLTEGAAGAFAVSTLERTFFLAIGNNVYYAAIP